MIIILVLQITSNIKTKGVYLFPSMFDTILDFVLRILSIELTD
jgi:hypothetical protein